MSTSTETPPDAKYMLREPVATILLEDNLSAIPKEVETANQEACSAWDAFQDAQRRLRHARDEQKLAPSLDAAADASAVAAGKELPEQRERATFATLEAVHACARREQAARTLARDAQLALGYCIHKHQVMWISDQGSVVSATQDECLDLLERLGVAYAALTRERVLLDGLEKFPQGGHLDYCRMGRIHAPQSAPLADLEAIKEAINPTATGNTLAASNSAPMSRRTLGGK
jgi:hypothetical protein